MKAHRIIRECVKSLRQGTALAVPTVLLRGAALAAEGMKIEIFKDMLKLTDAPSYHPPIPSVRHHET